MAKRGDAPYRPGRRLDAWLKHKHRHRDRMTITAWRPGERHHPDEVLVSRRDEAGTLRYAGAVRFGLTYEKRRQLRGRPRTTGGASPPGLAHTRGQPCA